MRIRILNIAMTGALLVPASVALTETIVLKNGSVIKGSIVQMTETDVTIETSDMGQVVVKRRTIQSINDGVVSTPEVGVAQPPVVATSPAAGAPLVINNNNNNNNNNSNNNAVSAAPAAAAQEKPTDPVVQASKVQDLGDSTLLGGQLSFGYGLVGVSMPDRTARYSGGPAIHWIPLSYRFSNGLTLSAVGDGIVPSNRDSVKGDSIQMLHAGGGLGWTSAPPQAGSGGGIWAMNLTYGYGKMIVEQKVTTSTWSSQYPPTESYPTSTTSGGQPSLKHQQLHEEDGVKTSKYAYEGDLAGANISYTYFASGGAGLSLGASALKGRLYPTKNNPVNENFYDEYNAPEAQTKSVTGYMAYAGLAYRF